MRLKCFSTLQRVEIAEILYVRPARYRFGSFSTLQRVEIAEIDPFAVRFDDLIIPFQYSSTSRNC